MSVLRDVAAGAIRLNLNHQLSVTVIVHSLNFKTVIFNRSSKPGVDPVRILSEIRYFYFSFIFMGVRVWRL